LVRLETPSGGRFSHKLTRFVKGEGTWLGAGGAPAARMRWVRRGGLYVRRAGGYVGAGGFAM